MRPSRTSMILGLVLAATLLAAGCGGSDKKASDTTAPKPIVPASDQTTTSTTSASTSTSASTTAASSTTTAPSTTTTAASGNPARCTAAQLNISVGPNGGGAAAGHQGVAVVWQNSSSTDCLMTGWAGADGLDANGASATHAVRTDRGYLGGLAAGATAPQIVLRPGDSASSLVEGTSVPTGDAACPTYAALLVTPPEDTTSVKLDATLPGCSGLQIHPVVAGTTGTQS